MKTYILLFIALMFSTMANASTATTGSSKYNDHAKEIMLKRFDSVKADVYHASVTTGVDMTELIAIGSLESKLQPKAKNPSSTAAGVLQYTNGTWKHKRKQYAKELGIPANVHQSNQKANLLIGGMDLQETKERLIARTWLTEETLTLGDVYLSHFLGEDGAVKVINSNSYKPINQIVSIHRGNNYYYKPNGKYRTAREMRQHMNQLVNEEIKVYQLAITEYQIERVFAPVYNVASALKDSQEFVAAIPKRFAI